jgi:hypothetical protein
VNEDVVSVKPLRAMRLRLKFKDGAEGEVDLARWIPKRGDFRPRFGRAFFRKVRVNPDTGTICWPNDADVDPLVLHHWATGKPLPKWAGPLEDGCPSCTRRIERSRAAPRAARRDHRHAVLRPGSLRPGSGKSR